jgi:hypothetical protein
MRHFLLLFRKATTVAGSFLLLEDGSNLLLEDGTNFLTEA